MDSVIKMAGDNFGATRVSWHEDILADIALFKMNVML
jgi:hypothetical protein